MKFIFDENISVNIARALKLLRLPVLNVQDQYGKGTRDEVLLPSVGQRQLIFVTWDGGIRAEPAQRLILEVNGVTAVFMHTGLLHEGFHKQALWFLKNWEKMVAALEGAPPGASFRATTRGKVLPMR